MIEEDVKQTRCTTCDAEHPYKGGKVPKRRKKETPTALYKEALALLELKQTRLAQARLQYLLDNFPQSEEAPLAKERLANLGG